MLSLQRQGSSCANAPYSSLHISHIFFKEMSTEAPKEDWVYSTIVMAEIKDEKCSLLWASKTGDILPNVRLGKVLENVSIWFSDRRFFGSEKRNQHADSQALAIPDPHRRMGRNLESE
jgi:hypothetical protein